MNKRILAPAAAFTLDGSREQLELPTLTINGQVSSIQTAIKAKKAQIADISAEIAKASSESQKEALRKTLDIYRTELGHLQQDLRNKRTELHLHQERNQTPARTRLSAAQAGVSKKVTAVETAESNARIAKKLGKRFLTQLRTKITGITVNPIPFTHAHSSQRPVGVPLPRHDNCNARSYPSSNPCNR